MRAELPPSLPLMALRSTIVYPLGTIAVQMGAPENLALLRAHEESGLIVALVVAAGEHDEAVDPHHFVGRVGVAARVHERINLPGDTIQITLQGLRRITIESIDQVAPFAIASVKGARETPPDSAEVDELIARTVTAAETMAELVDRIPSEVPQILKMNVADPGRFADLAATNMNLRIADKEEVLQRLDIGQRLRFLLSRLEREVARARVIEDVKRSTEVKIEQHQREFYLRQQLRAIQSELGEADPNEKDAVELLRQIDEAKLPEKVAQEARRETERLRLLSPASSEYQVLRTYMDTLLALPWHARSAQDQEIVLTKVEAALDDRHYGLDEAKERITEYLAVRKLRGGDPHGPILCFVGPPGTGKTSLGEAIAKAIGREFYRISVGGVRDEAEIRGHRRTYIGALPGRLIQAMRKSEVINPLVLLDEVDKMGADWRGDPAAALLEVLDPEQNHTFTDHYLEVDYDLSQVMFVTTANSLSTIPEPLRDRLEIIRLPGYLENEKLEIARRYLWPRQLAQCGIDPLTVTVDEDVLPNVIRGWTQEAGVRDLERRIARLARKLARKAIETPDAKTFHLARKDLNELLGPPPFEQDDHRLHDQIGVAQGLAYTSIGGDLLEIEVSVVPGRGRVQLTGTLGDVIKESAAAALSYVRTRATELGIAPDFYKTKDIHVHLPAGATPKDGPSAGIAIATALASALSGKPVRGDFAMTGEITLRGRVLPIGGLREKGVAAHRHRVKHVIVPALNTKDLTELPADVRAEVTWHPVRTMDEVLALVLRNDLPTEDVAVLAAKAARRKLRSGNKTTLSTGVSKARTPKVPNLPSIIQHGVPDRTMLPNSTNSSEG